MRFIDSNVIAYAFYENDYQDYCQTILNSESNVTDTFTLAEAFNIIEYQIGREKAIVAVKGFLRSSTEIVNVDINVLFEALKKAEQYKKLKFLDLVHFTVASLKQCESIVSYDKDFDALEIPRVEK